MTRTLSVTAVDDGVCFASTPLCSWVILHDENRVVLIDCGYPGQARQVDASLRMAGVSHLPVEAVLLTHAHADHAGTAARLRSRGVRILASAAVVAAIRKPKLEQVRFTDIVQKLWRPRYLLWTLSAVIAGGLSWKPVLDAEVIDCVELHTLPGAPIPQLRTGHAEGHTIYSLLDGNVLVAGDALAAAHPLVGRFPQPGALPDVFNRNDSQAASEAAELREAPGVLVLPGHGPAFIIASQEIGLTHI